MNKSKKLLFSKILLAVLGVFVAILVIKYLPNILELTMSIDKFREYTLSLGKLGPLVVILFQILQTIVAPIPGEVVQIAAGYVYGIPLGTFYVIAGMMIGSMMAFFFSRFMGGSFIENLLKKNNFQWMLNMMDGKKFSILLFIFFFVPGLPKDFLVYLAGLTPIKPIKFFTLLLVSRFPWLLASVTIGANIYQKDYVSTIVISVIALLAFVLGLVYKEKIINKFSAPNKDINDSQSTLLNKGEENMIKKIIPNFMTFSNLSFGVFSILMIIRQNYTIGAIFIIISAIIDRYDGRIANHFDVTSELGKELDSLADMVSFGVAPALLVYYKFNFVDLNNGNIIGICFMLLYIVSGCYRLAKYNITAFDGYFTGVPITVGGLILATYSLFSPDTLTFTMISMVLLAVLAYLMISKFKLEKK